MAQSSTIRSSERGKAVLLLLLPLLMCAYSGRRMAANVWKCGDEEATVDGTFEDVRAFGVVIISQNAQVIRRIAPADGCPRE
jgi:hypothetical protein